MQLRLLEIKDTPIFCRPPATDLFDRINFKNRNVFNKIASIRGFHTKKGKNESINTIVDDKIDFEKFAHIKQNTLDEVNQQIKVGLAYSNLEKKKAYNKTLLSSNIQTLQFSLPRKRKDLINIEEESVSLAISESS